MLKRIGLYTAKQKSVRDGLRVRMLRTQSSLLTEKMLRS